MNNKLHVGLSPGNYLWGIKASFSFSSINFCLVFPSANASGCEKKFDINSSWLLTGYPSTLVGCWDFVNPMNSIGITLPWCKSWKKLCWPFVPGSPKLTTAVWYLISSPLVLILFPLLSISNCWMWGANLHKLDNMEQ